MDKINQINSSDSGSSNNTINFQAKLESFYKLIDKLGDSKDNFIKLHDDLYEFIISLLLEMQKKGKNPNIQKKTMILEGSRQADVIGTDDSGNSPKGFIIEPLGGDKEFSVYIGPLKNFKPPMDQKSIRIGLKGGGLHEFFIGNALHGTEVGNAIAWRNICSPEEKLISTAKTFDIKNLTAVDVKLYGLIKNSFNTIQLPKSDLSSEALMSLLRNQLTR